MEINLKNEKKALANINNRNCSKYDLMILEASGKAVEKEPEPKQSKEKATRKTYPLELHEEFIKEIRNDEKIINEKIFK